MDPVGNNISPSFIFIGEKYCFVHKEFSKIVRTFFWVLQAWVILQSIPRKVERPFSEDSLS